MKKQKQEQKKCKWEKEQKKIELNFSQQFRSRFLLFQEEKIKVSSNVKSL